MALGFDDRFTPTRGPSLGTLKGIGPPFHQADQCRSCG